MKGVIRARAVPEGAALQVQGVWGHRRQSLSCREREDCESRPGRQGFLTRQLQISDHSCECAGGSGG